MKDLETRVRDSLKRDADAVRFEPGRWTRVSDRKRHPRRAPAIRTLGAAAAAVVLLAGIVVPLALVSGLGGDETAEPVAPAPEALRRHVDPDDGLAITIPEAWSFHADPTRLIEPENVLALGSWPFPRGGVCAPFDAIDDLPPDGVFIWLIEYHGPEPAEDFVPRPEPFDLRDFNHGEVSCYAPDPQYQLRFRDAGRNFQVQIAFGPDASGSLETEVLRSLESLETRGICDPAGDAYVPVVAPAGGPSGSTATVTGEVPHGEGAEGGSPADPTEWVEVWWNLDPSDPGGWPSALPGGEDPIPAEPGPVLLLSRLHVAGTCTYELPFTVPETLPGSYPVVVLYGSDVSGSAFQPAWFEVTG